MWFWKHLLLIVGLAVAVLSSLPQHQHHPPANAHSNAYSNDLQQESAGPELFQSPELVNPPLIVSSAKLIPGLLPKVPRIKPNPYPIDDILKLSKQLISSCSSNSFILINQPGLTLTDLKNYDNVPNLISYLDSFSTVLTFPFAESPSTDFFNKKISNYIIRNCNAEIIHVNQDDGDDDDSVPHYIDTRTKIILINFSKLPTNNYHLRNFRLQENDLILKKIIRKLPTPYHSIFLTSLNTTTVDENSFEFFTKFLRNNNDNNDNNNNNNNNNNDNNNKQNNKIKDNINQYQLLKNFKNFKKISDKFLDIFPDITLKDERFQEVEKNDKINYEMSKPTFKPKNILESIKNDRKNDRKKEIHLLNKDFLIENENFILILLLTIALSIFFHFISTIFKFFKSKQKKRFDINKGKIL
ncbi:Big1p ASCRUDRAFT_6872 [Ascoidea rubescens DSM 1968]|uniref:Protein BIG1 n=1 Tax=Ascoidea rubescens DSM 1968 TaxID=1344418 RepID=A0A1D2VL42_9ASCO|nr:hypothetical protein ASCRUDRAFT_6872 [Ascoidea rubescens DSM 1968]ODV62267.1 hypothetical protein ASCRUDRAFT_6872 [Ascoidea rubescens DSM 1968]